MNQECIHNLIKEQRNFFMTGATKNIDFRVAALKKLQTCIRTHEKQISEVLYADLGKSDFESYMCECGLVLSELSYMLKHIRPFSREKTVPTPMAQFCSRSYRKPSPYGVVLVMSPWNYPFLLTMDPIIDAIAAGNTVVVKPSAYSPHTSQLIADLLRDCFPEEYVGVILGGREENKSLLQEKFDYIFFTGSQSVGREVMRNAAENITPFTLELGGKSPCIIDKSANLNLAAKRIVFGKYLNCGQTCVAPDYIYCDKTVKEELLHLIRKEIEEQFGKSPLENPNYGKIINEKHFDRICGLIEKDKIFCGGEKCRDTLQIAPTVLDHSTFTDLIMQEEIFGPVLPVITYDSLAEAIQQINSMSHPLALYIFSENQRSINHVISDCQFGGGCVNDTVIHLATSYMPFGGVGESGIGSYHGKVGFETFSHYKSIVDKKTWLDLPMRYQPYREINKRIIRFFLK